MTCKSVLVCVLGLGVACAGAEHFISKPQGLASKVAAHARWSLRLVAEQQNMLKTAELTPLGKAPKMPTKWVAFVNQTQIVNGTTVPSELPFPTGDALPRFAVDKSTKRLASQYYFKFSYAPQEYVGTPMEWFNSTVFVTDTFEGTMMNSNKYVALDFPQGGLFQDMFSWVPFAQDGGIVSFKGRKLHRWFLHYNSTKLELLTDDADLPVHMHTENGGSGQITEFVSFDANAEVPGLWDNFNEESFRNPVLCPEPSHMGPMKTSMYIFHPKGEFNISGQDLGDATGDVFFTCTDVIDGQNPMLDHDYAWITQWEVELVPRWGQYQNCNGYNPAQCIGLNNFWVGRESSNYIGEVNPKARQCGPTNPLVGAWWSLPEGGRCGPGQRPGDGTCTWRERRVKTVDSKCLFSGNTYKAACEKDGRGPFPAATVLFLEAFASEDPGQNGCENIVPTLPAACSWNAGCVGLAGDCCPAVDGTMLACCGSSTTNSSNSFVV